MAARTTTVSTAADVVLSVAATVSENRISNSPARFYDSAIHNHRKSDASGLQRRSTNPGSSGAQDAGEGASARRFDPPTSWIGRKPFAASGISELPRLILLHVHGEVVSCLTA